MKSPFWADQTWNELATRNRARLVLILPIGAIEAHGPHLPLDTDHIIARAMAEAAVRALATRGHDALILPPFDLTAAPFAAAFPGTLSLAPQTVGALFLALIDALAEQGWRQLLLANSHFDPSHVRVLRESLSQLAHSRPEITIVFPDLTRRHFAERLTAEFRSGACHGGQYETSIVLAARPEQVREQIRSQLEPVAISLVDAIRSGRKDFGAAGGAHAYFGDPAAASAEEGEATIELLGSLLAEAFCATAEKKEARQAGPLRNE